MTPIYWAASRGRTEIVKMLAAWTDNFNADVQHFMREQLRKSCMSPWNDDENTETVQIFAPLIDNPNAPDEKENGRTPIFWALIRGHTKIVKILAPLTNHPNAPDKYGDTPIYVAALHGHTEIVKILAPFTDNPNAPNNHGRTPSAVARYTEIQKFLESFNSIS